MKRVSRALGPWTICVRGALVAAILLAAFAVCAAQTGAPSKEAPKPSGAKPGASSAAKRTLNVVAPGPGEWFIRLLPSSDAKAPAQLPIRFTDAKTSVSFDPAELGSKPKIAIDDAKTGNTAILPLPTGDTLELHRSDFDHVHTVRVNVLYDNKPVQVAQVTLTPSDKTPRPQTIDRFKQGVASFDDVPAGKATLTIKYGANFTENRDVDITTDHPGDVQTVNAAVTNKVDTLDVPAAPAASTGNGAPGAAPGTPGAAPAVGPAPATAPEGGGFTGMIGTILGLAVAVGAIYLLYRWAQSGGMAATLKKAGIEVAGPQPGSDAGTPWQPNAPAPPVVSDPSMCQYCGQKKDAAGNCACTLSGAAINTGPSSPAVPTQPRLVGTVGVYSGTIFPLNVNGTAVTLGREATNSIALNNDTSVSRRHAAIRVENGTYIVSDEGSSNGVYVNGVRISGSQALRPGDEVQIGNTRFRFEV